MNSISTPYPVPTAKNIGEVTNTDRTLLEQLLNSLQSYGDELEKGLRCMQWHWQRSIHSRKSKWLPMRNRYAQAGVHKSISAQPTNQCAPANVSLSTLAPFRCFTSIITGTNTRNIAPRYRKISMYESTVACFIIEPPRAL